MNNTVKQQFLQSLIEDLGELFYNLDKTLRTGSYNGIEIYYLRFNQLFDLNDEQVDKIERFFPYEQYNFVAKLESIGKFEIEPGERYYYPTINFVLEEI